MSYKKLVILWELNQLSDIDKKLPKLQQKNLDFVEKLNFYLNNTIFKSLIFQQQNFAKKMNILRYVEGPGKKAKN